MSQLKQTGEFIQECWVELQRVTWPDWPQLKNATLVVIYVLPAGLDDDLDHGHRVPVFHRPDHATLRSLRQDWSWHKRDGTQSRATRDTRTRFSA
jgi:hypothetical protein